MAMVEPSRSAGAKCSTTTTTVRKKKLTATSPVTLKQDKEKPADQGGNNQQSSHVTAGGAAAAVKSPSYRLALRSLFSCRNNHTPQHQHNQRAAPLQPAPTDDGARSCKKKSKKQTQLGCSASICKLRDASPRWVMLHRPPAEEEAPSGAATGADEPCKRRASVSGAGERRMKKLLQQPQQGQSEAALGSGEGGGGHG